jgi:hypothetical protein
MTIPDGNAPGAGEQADQIYDLLTAGTITWEQAEQQFRASGLHNEAHIEFFKVSWQKKQQLATTNLSSEAQLRVLIIFVNSYLDSHPMTIN